MNRLTSPFALVLFTVLALPGPASADCHFSRGRCRALVDAFEDSWNLAATADAAAPWDIRPAALRGQAPPAGKAPSDRGPVPLWTLFRERGRLVPVTDEKEVKAVTGRDAIRALFRRRLQGSKYTLVSKTVTFEEFDPDGGFVLARWQGTVAFGDKTLPHDVTALLVELGGEWYLDTVIMGTSKTHTVKRAELQPAP